MVEKLESTSARFDFIGDERFRESLTADYREINLCVEAQAWKAVHVLAGSIVEALLVEYLVISDYRARGGKDPLTLDMNGAIDACLADKVLTQKAAGLCNVVRGFRNLIHPGRAVRLNEEADRNTALIAKALVEIVIDEISKGKTANYGFTAEQIINKLIRDRSAISILSHFLKDTTEFERVQLLRTVPDRYFELRFSYGGYLDAMEVLPDLRKCFRQTFGTLSVEKKRIVAKQFVDLLKEADEDRVLQYETTFFLASDLEFLSEKDAAMAKEHLLSRMSKPKEVSKPVLEALEGIGPHLDAKEIEGMAAMLMRVIVYHTDKNVREEARLALGSCYWSLSSDEGRETMKNAAEWWVKTMDKQDSAKVAAAIEARDRMMEEFPF